MLSQTDFVPIVIFIIILLFCRFDQPKEGTVFSYDNSLMLKGLMAMTVILCHLSHYYGNGPILPLFSVLGNFAVGIFFFLSGYGLMKQYLNKPDYQSVFLKKRLVSVLIPYLIITLIYWAYNYFFGEYYSIRDVILSLFTDEPFVTYSWYLNELIVLYIFFYLFMFITRKNKKMMIVLNIVLYLLFVVYYKNIVHYNPYWYHSTHMYTLGMIWVCYEDKIQQFISRFYIPILIISFLILIYDYYNIRLFPLKEIAFLLIFAVIFQKTGIRNSFLRFSGKMTMELYLLHALVIRFFRYFISDVSDFVSVFLLVVCIYIASYIMHLILSKFTKLIKI